MEQRATGQFLKVLGPTGVVVSIAGWMLDPTVCGGMTMGAPRLELAALIDLNRLLMGTARAAHSRSARAIAQEAGNDTSQNAGSTLNSANELAVRQRGGLPRDVVTTILVQLERYVLAVLKWNYLTRYGTQPESLRLRTLCTRPSRKSIDRTLITELYSRILLFNSVVRPNSTHACPNFPNS